MSDQRDWNTKEWLAEAIRHAIGGHNASYVVAEPAEATTPESRLTITRRDTGKVFRVHVAEVRDIRCPVCGSTSVQESAWIWPQDDTIVNDEPPTDRIWCADCDEQGREGNLENIYPCEIVDGFCDRHVDPDEDMACPGAPPRCGKVWGGTRCTFRVGHEGEHSFEMAR